MRVVVSGGGTAGHVMPVLATVDELQKLVPDAELLYVGQQGGVEQRLAEEHGLEFAGINAGKWRRNQSYGRLRQLADVSTLGPNLRDTGRLVAGFGQAAQVLRRFKPDIVLAKGGFVTVPVGLAARFLRIPYIIHESDFTPGLTNRILAGGARAIGVGFPVKSYQDLPPDKLVYTGNPSTVASGKRHRLEGITHFGLQTDLPVIVVTGGSQGARRINELVVAALPELLEKYQIIHVAGELEHDNVRLEVERLRLAHPARYCLRDFLRDDLALAYAAADLVIGRAGAGTISDAAILGLPLILIPNSTMAGHQVHNARLLSRAGAAQVLDEVKLTAEGLVKQIDQIMQSDDEQASLSRHVKAFGVPDGAQRLAKLLIQAAGERTR